MPVIPGKFIIDKIFGEKVQSGPRIGFFGFFENLALIFPGNDLK